MVHTLYNCTGTIQADITHTDATYELKHQTMTNVVLYLATKNE